MRENIVKFGRELGATLEVYVATFCIFCNFLASFRILHSNFSHFTQQLFRNLQAQSVNADNHKVSLQCVFSYAGA
jgi:hypothetical protein